MSMNFRGFKSEPPKTPYAPTWDFLIATSYCKNIDLTSFSSFLVKKEKEVKTLPISMSMGYEKKFTDGGTGLGRNSTTSRFKSYNLLKWNTPEINNLRQKIHQSVLEYNNFFGNKVPNQLWIQCWFNVLRFGQKIKPHMHSTLPESYLSGHFNVQVENTSTVYMSPINQLNHPDIIEIENKNGDITLFPSYIFHYTTPHYSLKPRITIAFDILYEPRSSNWIML